MVCKHLLGASGSTRLAPRGEGEERTGFIARARSPFTPSSCRLFLPISCASQLSRQTAQASVNHPERRTSRPRRASLCTMLLPRLILPLCAFASTSTALSDHQQIVLALAEPPSATAAARRPLKGRFLHLTDVHPDPFYRAGTSEDEACHFPSNKRKKHKHKKKHGHKGKKGKGKAGESGGPRAGEEEEDDAAGPLDGLGDDAVATLTDDPRSAGHWGLPIRCAAARSVPQLA